MKNKKTNTLPFNVMQFDEKMFQNASPSQVLPIMMALDLSGSMNAVVGNSGKTCFELLCEALHRMINTIADDPMLKHCVELGIITFSTDVKIVRPFSTLEEDSSLPTMCASGLTRIGEAIVTAAQEIRAHKHDLVKKGNSNVVHPVLLVLSDGVEFESSPSALFQAKNDCHSGDFNVVPIFIGEDNGAPGFLSELEEPINVNQLALGDLFEGIVAATTSSITTAAEKSFRELLASALSWTETLEKNGK